MIVTTTNISLFVKLDWLASSNIIFKFESNRNHLVQYEVNKAANEFYKELRDKAHIISYLYQENMCKIFCHKRNDDLSTNAGKPMSCNSGRVDLTQASTSLARTGF